MADLLAATVRQKRSDWGFDAVDGHAGGGEKEFSHLDVYGGIGPEAKIVFGNALNNHADGFNGLLDQVNLGVCTRPRIALLNKIPIQNADEAVLMFSAAARGIARAFAKKVKDGTIPADVADKAFFVVTVFIAKGSKSYDLVERNNHEAALVAIDNFAYDTNNREHMLAHMDDPHALAPKAAAPTVASDAGDYAPPAEEDSDVIPVGDITLTEVNPPKA